MDRFDLIDKWKATVNQFIADSFGAECYGDYLLLEEKTDYSKEKAIELLKSQLKRIESVVGSLSDKTFIVMDGGKYRLVGYLAKKRKGDNNGKVYKKSNIIETN